MDLDVSDLDELEDWIEQTRATHSRMPRAGLGRPLVRSRQRARGCATHPLPTASWRVSAKLKSIE
jgi:hypothetical protein